MPFAASGPRGIAKVDPADVTVGPFGVYRRPMEAGSEPPWRTVWRRRQVRDAEVKLNWCHLGEEDEHPKFRRIMGSGEEERYGEVVVRWEFVSGGLKSMLRLRLPP